MAWGVCEARVGGGWGGISAAVLYFVLICFYFHVILSLNAIT